MNDSVITKEQASNFLNLEVSLKSQSIDLYLGDDLNSNEFGGLVSFTYNIGEGALRSGTFRKKVNAIPKDPSIRNGFAKWTHSNGKVVKGLIRRREVEANLNFTKQ
ncbi:MAG: lysozyme [Ferruginibacter sp.]